MVIDSAVIEHHEAETIPLHKLKEIVHINEKYLKEKSTWYKIKHDLEYFKVRDDIRLFTEIFFSNYAKKAFDLDTVDYRLAYVTLVEFNKKASEAKLGLLSENFQIPGRNYYLVSEMLKSENSDLCHYGDFTFKTLLDFFKETVAEDEYNIIKNFLVRLFIADSFTFQQDRNEHNISFEVPKIQGISHTKRLRPYSLVEELKNYEDIIDCTSDVPKLKKIRPSKVYDNERLFGYDHNNVNLYKKGMIWTPLFPYNKDLLFQNQEEAIKAYNDYDNLDPNLTELYLNYNKEAKPFIEKMAKDDEYKKELENFSYSNSPIHLSSKEIETIETVIQDRQKEFQKVLRLG